MPISEEELSYRRSIFRALRNFVCITGDVVNFEFVSDAPPYKLLVMDTGAIYWNKMDIQVDENILVIGFYRRLIESEPVETPESYDLIPTTKLEPFSIADERLWLSIDLLRLEQYNIMLLSEKPDGKIAEVPTLMDLSPGQTRQIVKVTIALTKKQEKITHLSFWIRLPKKGVYLTKEDKIRSTFQEFINTLILYNKKYNRNWRIHLVK